MPTNDDLQRQIVELRLRMDQQQDSNAASIDFLVKREIATVMGDRLPPPDVTAWAVAEYEKAKQRTKDYRDLVLHSAKFGAAAALAFFAMAVWETVKAKLTGGK